MINPNRGKSYLSDIIAGITVSIILLPQAMAYAVLAGLDPIFGLYSSIIPLIAYSIWGSSIHLAVGPVALMSIILLSSVGVFAEPGTDEYVDLVLFSGFIAGLLQIGFGILKLGRFSSLLSKPVLKGFITAAGTIIIFSQIRSLLGTEAPRRASFVDMIKDIYEYSHTADLSTFLIGLIATFILIGIKKINRLIPGALVVVLLGSILVYNIPNLQTSVKIIGDLPQGLPSFYAGFLDINYALDLFPSAFIIAFVCFIGSYAIGKSLEVSIGSVVPNKELIGLGMSKVLGSFFYSMPSSGSFSRSVINKEAGVQTKWSGGVTAIIVILFLLFGGSWFYYLPYTVLAAIIITSVWGLLDWSYASKLWFIDKTDFYAFVITFASTLTFGIVEGILWGIGISLFLVINRSTTPHFAVLGRIRDGVFRNVNRFPEAQEVDGVLIMRYDQDLFFGNADHFYNCLNQEMNKKENLEVLVIHFGAVNNIDSTAWDKIAFLIENCNDRNIAIRFTNVAGPIRDYFKKNDVLDNLKNGGVYINVNHALENLPMVL